MGTRVKLLLGLACFLSTACPAIVSAQSFTRSSSRTAQARLPTVTVLAFLTENLTRDEEIALCNAF